MFGCLHQKHRKKTTTVRAYVDQATGNAAVNVQAEIVDRVDSLAEKLRQKGRVVGRHERLQLAAECSQDILEVDDGLVGRDTIVEPKQAVGHVQLDLGAQLGDCKLVIEH